MTTDRPTVRAVLAGAVLAVVLCGVNAYLTLSFGVIEEGPTIAALFFFAFFFLSRRKITSTEMVIVATMGSAGGSLGFISNFFAARVMVGETMTVPDMAVFAAVTSLLGLLFVIPLRELLILREDLPWPGSRARAGWSPRRCAPSSPCAAARPTPTRCALPTRLPGPGGPRPGRQPHRRPGLRTLVRGPGPLAVLDPGGDGHPLLAGGGLGVQRIRATSGLSLEGEGLPAPLAKTWAALSLVFAARSPLSGTAVPHLPGGVVFFGVLERGFKISSRTLTSVAVGCIVAEGFGGIAKPVLALLGVL